MFLIVGLFYFSLHDKWNYITCLLLVDCYFFVTFPFNNFVDGHDRSLTLRRMLLTPTFDGINIKDVKLLPCQAPKS